MSAESKNAREGRHEVLLVEPSSRREHHGSASWWLFAREVLAHAGVTFTPCVELPEDLPVRGTLLFAVPPTLEGAAVERLATWVDSGGSVVAIGGTGDLSGLVDVTDGLHLPGGSRVQLEGRDGTVPVFGGCVLDVEAEGARTLATDSGSSPVATVVRRGDGSVQIWGADLWQTLVRIVQGWPVHADGTPAEDGSMPLDEGVLKCDDGIALDFALDRSYPPGEPEGPNPYPYQFPPESSPLVFAVPVADVWRNAFLAALLRPVSSGIGVPFIDQWPSGEAAMVHISQDADGNMPEEAEAAVELWRDLGVRTTWCMLFPGGYGADLLEEIRVAGHEIALHYSALGDSDISNWGYAELEAQLSWLRAWNGGRPVVTNKNHYTRWEGWAQFFEWCERLGIEVDQTRGPSKLGGVGFPFGTTHVWKPLTDGAGDGRLVDVLAMPLHTQDLGLAAHESIRGVILDGAIEHGGVAHFLFHPMHIRERELVRGTCRRLVQEVARRGLSIRTAEEINAWERSRRTVQSRVLTRTDEVVELELSAEAELGVTLAIPITGSGVRVSLGGKDLEPTTVRRRGLHLIQVPLTVPARPEVVRVAINLVG